VKEDCYERVKRAGHLMVEKRLTVRKAAEILKVSKTTIHIDVSKRLKNVDPYLYKEVRELLNYHKEVRSKRGGMALKKKYKK